jgi:hypothetical protein
MKHQYLALLALLATAACGGASSDSARADSLQRDLAMAQADSTAQLNDRPAANPAPTTVTTPPARPRTPTPSSLASGTEFAGTVADSITSRRNKVGDLFRMNVGVDVKDAQGRTVIPAGSVVTLRIDEIAPAENDRDLTGKLRVSPTAVAIGGASYPLSASVDSMVYIVRGRGITAGDAVKVGAGAVAGAVAGRVITGNRTGTIGGAVIGAAAGAAVAGETNDRDVIIRPGAYMRIQLAGAFSRS